MKKIIIVICILVIIFLLFPMREQAKDGSTVKYQAVLYTVTDMHKISITQNEDGSFNDGFIVGIIVEILGIKVFDNTHFVPSEQ